MNTIYKDLADIYEAMYYTFIDYKEEYEYYNNIITRYNKKNVLEIGCGTGNLAGCFIKDKLDYIGLDFSDKMLSIAKSKTPNGRFIKGDMRDFKLHQSVESVIITGRSVSYLVKNMDVNLAMSSIYDNLKTKGILCFDFIDANEFIPLIAKEKKVIHEATHNDVKYVRKSIWNVNLEYAMDFRWDAVFYKEEENKLIKIGEDSSVVRAFTKNEIEIFLSINGFRIIECIPRKAYAFSTYVVIAEKVN
ncbi:class I SAM-dependent methyltransferase [Aquimarina sp. 2201CG5-10]|uniref:class I SAM-dependent DNA methyltransferase n=1 Tax=Aquimarina callyspongiae TaxID=3098150 RepID=UPI002AB36051|nr:class I SAM-dependent methyltransferase [Aquimarina sp. 2201CG5-10]MDY8135660.1 class I SAM-dependent methyltransferase [Aquimarina sp. 2201CG5-10]